MEAKTNICAYAYLTIFNEMFFVVNFFFFFSVFHISFLEKNFPRKKYSEIAKRCSKYISSVVDVSS